MSARIKSILFWIALGFGLVAYYALTLSPEARRCEAKGGHLFLNGECAKTTVQIIFNSKATP